ncbi:hypothetical protein [Streptococcus pneumoniae]|uniref:hypothetical protein n=1 Tax=Streptococcus pneumoniae TaxID=1313 RepID=UPI0035ABBCE5
MIWHLLTLRTTHRREIVNVLTKMGFEVEASHHEVVGWTGMRLTLSTMSSPCL